MAVQGLDRRGRVAAGVRFLCGPRKCTQIYPEYSGDSVTVEMVIEALQEFVSRNEHMKSAVVTSSDFFSVEDIYVDVDENGDTVVVID